MEFLDRWGVTDEILINLCGKPFWDIYVQVPSYYRNKTLYRLDRVLELVAKNPKCPVSTLIKLSKYDSWAIKEKVAMNPSTPIELVEEMTFGMPELTQLAVMKRSVISERLARILSRSVYMNVRLMVATKPFIKGENLQYLLNRDPSSRSRAIANPNLSTEELDGLFVKWGKDCGYHNNFCLNVNFNTNKMNELLGGSAELRECFIICNVSALSMDDETYIQSDILIGKLNRSNLEILLADIEALIQRFLEEKNKSEESYPNYEQHLRSYYEPLIRLLKQGLNS